jgi:hypothetical protein
VTATSKSKANYIALTPRFFFFLVVYFFKHHHHHHRRWIVEISFSRRKLFRRRTSLRSNDDRPHQNECTSTKLFFRHVYVFFQFPALVIANVCRCLYEERTDKQKEKEITFFLLSKIHVTRLLIRWK